MRTWQPLAIEYPDVEQVMCDGTRALDLPTAYVGRTVPKTCTTAIVWNRVGGTDPTALMQARVYAPTDKQATDLARALAAALPLLRDGAPVTRITTTGGPTDLGKEGSPMRQLLYDVTVRGTPL